MSNKNYTIIAGEERPDTIEIGHLEKKMGQGTILGQTERIPAQRGMVSVPNWTECWGVRVIVEDGEVPKTPIDVRDKEYRGQILPLPWGTAGGYMIQCRYLKGYNSVDQLYQSLVLNADAYVNSNQETAESAEIGYLFMWSGFNVYDPESDKYKVLMLKIHYLNKASKYKSPDSDKWWFDEYNADEDGPKAEAKLDAKFEALKVVNEASEDNSLGKLKNLLNIVKNISDREPKEQDLYKYLQILADSKPVEFLAQIDSYKRKISDIVEKAKSFKLIDLTTDGVIAAGDGKKEVIGQIPGKKESKIDWLISNYLDANSWAVILNLETLTSKF